MINSAPSQSTHNVSSSLEYDVERSVLERYQEGARQQQPSLCCPTSYDHRYLELLPEEIIQKDYGCGDPTQYVFAGETVVDLGSGAGKNCYILAQKVGTEGQVIGIDFNEEMLELARKYQNEIAEKIGFSNTQFLKGKIQDLKLNLDLVDIWLKNNPIDSIESWGQFETECDRIRLQQPLIQSNSVDVVVSNCVLNLVRPQDKRQLFQEIHRILKPGGRAVISDIVCNKPPTPAIMSDPDLWSGCIAGAFQESDFLSMFEKAGFYGTELLKREANPWQVIDGVEFRSVTIRSHKIPQLQGSQQQSVIYKGPWKKVYDDSGNCYSRGQQVTVDELTSRTLIDSQSPYSTDFITIDLTPDATINDSNSCCTPQNNCC